jgi:hypothetical protein
VSTFFYTRNGDMRPLRVCACIYAVIAVVAVIGSGWHSLRWVGWLLMALGFSAKEVPQPGQSQWRRSPGNWLSIVVMAIGVSVLFYSVK